MLISWKSIHERVKEFFILLLVLETAMIGVFVALDLFLFYFFWEATLIPMALLIGMYGHGRKIYAAVKFFLYTMIASVFMLAAILWLYAKTGSFDFVTIQNAIRSGQVAGFGSAALWLFLGFFVAFAVKVPLFPFHTWLPDAHVEAPTAGSVLLAGVLLKMGTYGMLRFNLGLFPEQARANAWWIMILALIGIIYGALVAHGAAEHEEADRLLLGQPPGICGAGHLQLHASGAGRRDFRDAGARRLHRRAFHAGWASSTSAVTPTKFPSSAAWRRHADVRQHSSLFIVLASVGLPLLNGFVGEFLVLSGAFQARAVYGILGATGVIWSACYLLWMYQRVFFGKVTHPVEQDAA